MNNTGYQPPELLTIASERDIPLTDKQRETLEYIKGYISENGRSPSQREIARHFSIDQKSVVSSARQGRLDYLKRKGYVTWTQGKYRSIEVIKS